MTVFFVELILLKMIMLVKFLKRFPDLFLPEDLKEKCSFTDYDIIYINVTVRESIIYVLMFIAKTLLKSPPQL